MDIKQIELRMVIVAFSLMAAAIIWNAIKRKKAIIDSKLGISYERDTKGNFFSFLIVIALTSLAAGIVYFKKTSMSVSVWIITIALIISLIAIKIYSKKHANDKQKDLYQSLVKMYNQVDVLPVNQPIKAPITNADGELQVVTNCCYSIPMYNCVFSSITLLKEQEMYAGDSRRSRLCYVPASNRIQYRYTFNKTVPNDILNTDAELHRTINEITTNKFVSFCIVNNCLLVDKETMLRNYTNEAREIDCRDVEYFYNAVVKKIMERNLL